MSVVVAVALILSVQQQATADPFLFSWDSDANLNKARTLKNDEEYERASVLLQQIVRENPGTELSGAARLELADIQLEQNNVPEAVRITEGVIAEFPDTAVGILAANNLIGLKYADGPTDTMLPHDDELIQRIGGVSLERIVHAMEQREEHGEQSCNDNSTFSFSAVSFLDYRTQTYLLNKLYFGVASTLLSLSRGKPAPGEFSAPAAYDREKVKYPLRLLHFIREHFPAGHEGFDEMVVYCLTDIFLTEKKIFMRSTFPDDNTPPRIRPIAPHDGQTIGDARPKIEVQVDDGDIRESQINTTGIQFTLDGQDLTRRMVIRTTYDRSAQFDVVFEKTRLIYRPEAPLATGPHTVFLRIPDHSRNVSEATWSFTVRSQGKTGDHGGSAKQAIARRTSRPLMSSTVLSQWFLGRLGAHKLLTLLRFSPEIQTEGLFASYGGSLLNTLARFLGFRPSGLSARRYCRVGGIR